MRLTENQRKALLKEAKFPALFAFLYVVLKWLAPNVESNHTVGVLKDAAFGFTALLFVQEQYQRVVKFVGDNDAQSAVNSRLDLFDTRLGVVQQSTASAADKTSEILDHLRQLGHQPPTNSTAASNLVPYAQSGAAPTVAGAAAVNANISSFMTQSAAAAQALPQYPMLSVLPAAIGFDYALDKFAERMGIPAKRAPSEKYRALSRLVPPQDFQRLRLLVDLRNALVHQSSDEYERLKLQLPLAIDEFRWGIDYLSSLDVGALAP